MRRRKGLIGQGAQLSSLDLPRLPEGREWRAELVAFYMIRLSIVQKARWGWRTVYSTATTTCDTDGIRETAELIAEHVLRDSSQQSGGA